MGGRTAINTNMQKWYVSNNNFTQALLATSFVASIWAFYTYGVTWQTVGLTILGDFIYVCLGIVVAFHRFHTHKAYNTHPWIIKLFTLFGCLAGTGSSIVWVSIHLKHHLRSDKEDDPHTPYVYGWKLFFHRYPMDHSVKWRMRELISDPYHRFLHRYYVLILLSWSGLLYLIGGWYLMIFLHWAPVVLSVFMSNIVNFSGHMPNWFGGSRRYNLSDKSANNWVWAIPSWGESWHNNHHRYPKHWYYGEKWYEIDISGLVIKLIKYE